MKRTTIIILIIMSAIFISSNNVNSLNTEEKHIQQKLDLEIPELNGYVSHDPIIITNDTELEIFPGNGTELDPYIIENYFINASLYEGEDICIYIVDTTKHVTIRDCYLITDLDGILIARVDPDTVDVINNTCSFNSIYHYEGNGIDLFDTRGIDIVDNYCTHFEEGISIRYSEFSNVTSNRLDTNELSLRVDYSPNSTIQENICLNPISDQSAVTIYNSDYSTFIGNNITTGGFYLSGIVDTLNFEDNYVTGKLFGFFVGLDNVVLTELLYGQIYLYECTSVVIRNQMLFSTSRAIVLKDCMNITVEQNILNDHGHGLTLYTGGANQIRNNTFFNNYIGLYAYSSTLNNISYNLFEENEAFGIHFLYCDRSRIHHNSFIDNNVGNPMFSEYPDAIQSQSFDQPQYNILSHLMDIWYDEATNQGNYWNDYTFNCDDSSIVYEIAADPLTKQFYYQDIYPLFEDLSGCYTPTPTPTPTDDTNFSINILMMIIFAAIVMYQRRKK